MVIPALFSCDFLTRGFRQALGSIGYDVAGWAGRVNFGPTQDGWNMLSGRVTELAAQSGNQISLIGHSLGGVIARVLAHQHPGIVRRVITICSPFRLPAATPLAPLYRALSLCHADNEILLPWLDAPPLVPTTAIYSPCDGIVAWNSCIDEPGNGRENVAISGRHTTMLADPRTLRVVAERLAIGDA